MWRLVSFFVFFAAACSESKTDVPVDRPLRPLTIWNSTQRPLEEVRVHEGAEYLSAANLLDAPLPDDERTVVDIRTGERVTVIRRNVDGGQRIAFTTATGLTIPTAGYVLQVFQESFRLHEPDPDGGNPDGSDSDGGDGDRDGGGDGGHGGDGDGAGGDP